MAAGAHTRNSMDPILLLPILSLASLFSTNMAISETTSLLPQNSRTFKDPKVFIQDNIFVNLLRLHVKTAAVND